MTPEPGTADEPGTAAGRIGLAALLADPARALVALDYDGTLAPIVDRPEDARPAPGARAALARLADRLGTVAIVTGRPVSDVVRFLELPGEAGLPRLLVCGQYGAERYADGTRTAPPPPAAVGAARDRLLELLAAAPPGVVVEDKRYAVAVHTRRAADPAAALARVAPAVRALAAELGLEVVAGRFVLELRPPGGDKGDALRRLVAERGAVAVLVAGDDLGDLPAFAAVEELRRGGVPGVTVCSGSEEVPELRRRADLVVDGPGGVVRLLRALAAAPPAPPGAPLQRRS